MKNRFLKLLTLFMVVGTMLVGCGGNEADNGADTNTDTTVNTEADKKDDGEIKEEVDLSLYTETDWYYAFTDEANRGTDLVDGEELQNFNWNYVNKYVKLKDTLDCYTHEKYNTGFLKANISVVYLQTNGEWSTIGWEEDGVFGYIFVKTAELENVMEVTGDYIPPVEDTEEVGMSDKAKAHFDKIRAGIAEDNKTREETKKQYPDIEFPLLVEVDSPEGLELFGTFNDRLNSDEDVNNMIIALRSMDYTKFYIEYLGETEEYVNYNFYAIK